MPWVKVGTLADGFVTGPGVKLETAYAPPPAGTPSTTITIVR